MKKLLFLLSIIVGSGYILTQTACKDDECEITSLNETEKKHFLFQVRYSIRTMNRILARYIFPFTKSIAMEQLVEV
jgi:hypothetical protein